MTGHKPHFYTRNSERDDRARNRSTRGFEVWGSGCGRQDLELSVQGLGFGVRGVGLKVSCLGFRIEG